MTVEELLALARKIAPWSSKDGHCCDIDVLKEALKEAEMRGRADAAARIASATQQDAIETNRIIRDLQEEVTKPSVELPEQITWSARDAVLSWDPDCRCYVSENRILWLRASMENGDMFWTASIAIPGTAHHKVEATGKQASEAMQRADGKARDMAKQLSPQLAAEAQDAKSRDLWQKSAYSWMQEAEAFQLQLEEFRPHDRKKHGEALKEVRRRREEQEQS